MSTAVVGRDMVMDAWRQGRVGRVLFGRDNHDQSIGFTEGIDDAWLEHVLLTGVERFPWWSDMGIGIRISWWGYCAVSPDNSPIIGLNPGADGWVYACGFSAHGIMHAPATGVTVAELIADGKTKTVDVHHFRHTRFGSDGAVEVNIF